MKSIITALDPARSWRHQPKELSSSLKAKCNGIKRMALVSLVFLALSLAANAAAPDSKQTKTVPRDVYGIMDGMNTFVPVYPYGPMDVISLGDCMGTLTHLGASRIYSKHQPNQEGTAVMNGSFRIVAANGDEIVGTYEGPLRWGIPYVLLIADTPLVITGGTGRFAHASGTIEATAYVTFLGFDVWAWPITWVLEGTVSY